MDHRHTPELPMANRKAGNESCRWQPWPETVPAPAEAVCGRHRPPPVGSSSGGFRTRSRGTLSGPASLHEAPDDPIYCSVTANGANGL